MAISCTKGYIAKKHNGNFFEKINKQNGSLVRIQDFKIVTSVCEGDCVNYVIQ